jgi:hypothetical protein
MVVVYSLIVMLVVIPLALELGKRAKAAGEVREAIEVDAA